MKQFDPVDYRIFECVTGSWLYGTSTIGSDIDQRGVVVAPMDVLLDPFMNFEQKDSGFAEEDRVLYALGKFMNLCADANPNIIELLFVPMRHVLYQRFEWDLILENRQYFLSKNVSHRFRGYAHAQLEALKRHREWFIDPPDHKPTRDEFQLGQTPLVSEANLQNVLSVPHSLFFPEYRDELIREREYRDAKRKWDHYQQWQKNRNPKRKGTEEKFGYDTKYASHIFRLVEEGRQLLLNGEIVFPLDNADRLLQIKQGCLTYEQVLTLASDIDLQFANWYDQSSLPHNPNRNRLKELYLEIVKGMNK